MKKIKLDGNDGQNLQTIIARINSYLLHVDLDFIDEVILTCQKELDEKKDPVTNSSGLETSREYEQEKIHQLIRIRNLSARLRELSVAEECYKSGQPVPDFTNTQIDPKFQKRTERKPIGLEREHRTRIIDMNGEPY